MLGAVIQSGKNTLVLELPTGTMDLQTKLNSIGIQQTADQIRIADDDGRPIRVKLYASLPEEAHLLPLLSSDKSLADANSSMFLLNASPPEVQSQLLFGLIADRYGSLDDYLQEARSKLLVAPASSGVPEEDALSSALEVFESNPNHRLVVSAVQGDESDVFLLPMSDRDYAAARVRFDDFHDTAFQIEACRYNDHWRSLFDTVLQEEGLHALNELAAAFPFLQELKTYEAVIEYAGVSDSRSLIQLAEHLDDFEFYPGCNGCDDVAREWISNHPYLQISAELEDYFDYDGYGSEIQENHQGEFVSGGFVFMEEGMSLDDILVEPDGMELQ